MENNLIKHDNGMAVNMVVSRATEEVKGAIFMSKQFPRDPFGASQRINKMCSRKSLAEISQYTYPRGGQKVNGPSIRLAEAIAQACMRGLCCLILSCSSLISSSFSLIFSSSIC